ncbi:hypothetical protein F2Q70_00003912 [Brassica cretica]|uniref:Uncharacterized protein n=1 Tax=Brassica cretica TaxID=69181 RepID=A0A8S9IQD0_BRACR|nr:hypothetical protein F2Q70_00003912 [Brassica cretica]
MSYLEPGRRSNGRKTSPAVPRRNKSKILRRSDQTEPSETRNPLKDQLGTQPWKVPKPANREGRRDGSVHVARHLSPLHLKAGAYQCSEADGPAGLHCTKIEVSDLLRKGHLREFLSEKAKSHLSKETTGKPTEAALVSPPRQDRVIHVISGGSEVSGISHAAARKSTWNAKHGLEAAKPKCLLLGTDEISFTAKEQEKVLTPHHDTLVISLTVANCLVKRILVDNGSSGNIIFQAAYKDLRLEEGALTRRTTLKGKTKVL